MSFDVPKCNDYLEKRIRGLQFVGLEQAESSTKTKGYVSNLLLDECFFSEKLYLLKGLVLLRKKKEGYLIFESVVEKMLHLGIVQNRISLGGNIFLSNPFEGRYCRRKNIRQAS